MVQSATETSTTNEGIDREEDRSLGRQRQQLLGTRVSAILDAHPDALQVLIEGGFEPLANPVARMGLAHTVSLRQAFRIRGQDEAQQEALIARLLQLGAAKGG